MLGGTRRKVFEAREYQPREAALLLAWYRQLYDVEDRARARLRWKCYGCAASRAC